MERKIPNEISVLIVGGGPVGLSMALLLHRFGIDCIVIEKSTATTDHPKARGCSSRTMELFRQWGIEDRIRNRGLEDDADVILVAESFVGREFGRTDPEPNRGLTPAWKSIVAQDAVEEALVEALEECRFANLFFATEMLAIEECGDHVAVNTRCHETGNQHRITATYLIAADGANSPTRKLAGIETDGALPIATIVNEFWRADLSAYPVAREVAAAILLPADPEIPRASVLNTDGTDRWLTLLPVGIERDERTRLPTPEEKIALIRAHVGVPDLDVTLINSSIWQSKKEIAKSYRKGAIFLIGDAAHRFPPTGGFGMNSGIQDAHNLAWKLAYVLKGLADEALLDTYDQERRPVAHSNAQFSLENSKRMGPLQEDVRSGDPDRVRFWMNELNRHLHSEGQSLGLIYEIGAIVPDGTVAPVNDPRHYTPSDRPGGRFPHFWTDRRQTRSTLDWFDQGFTLVGGPEAEQWMEAGTKLARASSAPLTVRHLANTDRETGLAMGRRGAVLVRPDGHVAWRAAWRPRDGDRELASVMQTILTGTKDGP